jgi:hypothetical protein
MTTTSQVPAVLDYLVTAATAALAATDPKAQVFDGPNPSKTLSGVERALWVGWNRQSQAEPASVATQDFAFIDSGRTRDEDGVIDMTARSWSGGAAVKAQRDICAQLVAAVELLLRGTPQAGGPGDASMGGLCLWSGVTGPFDWYPEQITGGVAVACVFRIAYRARLMTS